ncbi:MAG TPA: sugar-transfer associated ATP-grasp domain-containing protein [Candidatus Brocadiaceae bacterium]
MKNSFSRQNLKQLYINSRNRLKYWKLKSIKRKEIEKIFANNPSLKDFKINDNLRNNIKLFWKKHGLQVDTLWHKAYIGVNGIEDHRYIPEDVFYVFIEPRLNRKDLFRAYVDKNSYDNLFTGMRTPKTILRNINGKYYDGNYEWIEGSTVYDFLKKYQGDFIVKPSIDSSGGKNIRKLQILSQKLFIDKQPVSIKDIEKIIPRDFLVQEFLEQHTVLKNIYPHSLNTMRVVTLRLHGTIHVLPAIAKFGSDGNYLDYNVNQGGVNCGINNEGKLHKFAVDKYFRKYYRHPSTDYLFENTDIPQYSSLLTFAKNLHKFLLYFDMASWDLAIDKNGEPVLVELNLINQGFSFIQVHHGPLFGDFTEELLNGNLRCYST